MGACMRSRLLYGTQAWYRNDENIRKLQTVWMDLLRQMVNGGWSRRPTPEDAEDTEFRRRYTNTDILHVKKKTSSLRNVTRSQYLKHICFVCCSPNTTQARKVLFANSRRPPKSDPQINIAKLSNFSIEQAKRSTQDKNDFAALVDREVVSATPW